VKREFKLTINETIIPVSVSGPNDGKLTITIGEDIFTASVEDGTLEKGIFRVTVGKNEYKIGIIPKSDSKDFDLTVNDQQYSASLKPISVTPKPHIHVTEPIPAASRIPTGATPSVTAPLTPTTLGTVTAPLPGRVVEVNVSLGDKVKRGDVILVLEAMKMLNQIRASQDGIVSQIHIQAGNPVEKGQPLVTIK
jgi:biotin carboxyl carrier protein